MLELQHPGPEPTILQSLREQTPLPEWDALERNKADRIAIRYQLNAEQLGLCVYCEKLLKGENGHIEHIKPRQGFKSEIFKYSNLAHSCDARSHCGHKKDNLSIPIEPRVGCNSLFIFSSIDGRFSPATGRTEIERQNVESTIRILGLNDPALARQRKEHLTLLIEAETPEERGEIYISGPFRSSFITFN